MEAQAFWLNFKSCFLKQNGNNPLYKHWLEPIVPSKVEKRGDYFDLTLQIPSDLHKKWIQNHLLKDFYTHVKSFYNGFCRVELEVVSNKLPLPKNNPLVKKKLQPQSFFNPDYNFQNFIIGKNNQLAYEAALAISKKDSPGPLFNPLLIYAPSGLGKTHLLNAIGQESLKNRPQSKVIYLSAERFLNEYISAIQNKQMDLFRKKYRKGCDLLLMDDIQVFAKGRGVQEEFFHTFNELYCQKTQVVVCCDQDPGNIPALEERIRTRLKGGLMLDIFYPDKETRLAILKSKAKRKGLFLSSQVLEQISSACKSSIREMEGVLNKIKIMTELYGGRLSLKEIEDILKSVQKNLTIEEIQKRSAKAFFVSLEELRSPSRKKQIVRARQTAMYLARKYLKKSLNDISVAFDKKDHTTVLNSIKKVEKLRKEDADFKGLLEDLNKEIHSSFF